MKEWILFVCAGNTCRSPIAAALARDLLPGIVAESAGVMADPDQPIADNAKSVVRESTGMDISDHRPQDVSELDLAIFDRLIALDHLVAEDLAPMLPSRSELLVWDVRDPYGRSLDEYQDCANTLRRCIEELVDDK